MSDTKSHFRREAKLNFLFPLVVIIMGIIGAIIVPRILRQLEIDRCLDSGGKFDDEQNICVGNVTEK